MCNVSLKKHIQIHKSVIRTQSCFFNAIYVSYRASVETVCSAANRKRNAFEYSGSRTIGIKGRASDEFFANCSDMYGRRFYVHRRKNGVINYNMRIMI